MASLEIFVKSMMPSLLELKVTPTFCFTFKIPDDMTATNIYYVLYFADPNSQFFTHRIDLVSMTPKMQQNSSFYVFDFGHVFDR